MEAKREIWQSSLSYAGPILPTFKLFLPFIKEVCRGKRQTVPCHLLEG